MSYKFKKSIFIVVFAVVVFGCQRKSSWDGSIELKNGIPIVKNHGTPVLAELPFNLKEVMRIGGEDLFDEMPLNRVFSAVQNKAGDIFVSDVGNYRIVQFNSDGRFAQAFGTRGNGPNEFGAVGGIEIHNDSLYAQDTRRMTISKIDVVEKKILNPVQVGMFGTWGIDQSGNIQMASFLALSDPESPSMRAYSKTGNVEGEFRSSYKRITDLNGVGAFPQVHFSEARSYYTWPYPYRVEILDTNMIPIRSFELNDVEFLPPTKPEVVSGMNIGGSLPSQISNVLEVEGEWILVEVRYSDINKPRRVDVFDLEGKYLSFFQLESGEGITSYSNGMLWSTINGGLRQEVLPFVLGKELY